MSFSSRSVFNLFMMVEGSYQAKSIVSLITPEFLRFYQKVINSDMSDRRGSSKLQMSRL